MVVFNVEDLMFDVKFIFVATLVQYFESLSSILNRMYGISGLCIVCRGFL